MKNLIHFAKVWFENKNNQIGLILSVCMVFVLVITQKVNSEPATAHQETSMNSDEYIPEGHSLVPLQLQNSEALQSLVGGFAVVNLYSASMDGISKGNLVGRKVKLIRSPKQPDQFSALVKSEEAPLLLGQSSPLFAVILSRADTQNSGFNIKKAKINRIQFTGDEAQ